MIVIVVIVVIGGDNNAGNNRLVGAVPSKSSLPVSLALGCLLEAVGRASRHGRQPP
jgi:hypothetical protein